MTEIQMMKSTAFQPVMLTEPAGGTKFSLASFMHFKMQTISATDNLKREEVFLVNYFLILKIYMPLHLGEYDL